MKKKIALLGNMNNNNFALLRYLLDKGEDADLFCFNNELTHFLPENDTWEIDRYADRIHSFGFGNPFKEIVGFQFNQIRSLKKYDILVGNGFAAYYAEIGGRKLDLFIPYGSDLYEYADLRLNFSNGCKALILSIINKWIIGKFQQKGLLNAKVVVSNDLFSTYKIAFEQIGIKYLNSHVPIVYHESAPNELTFSEYLDEEKLKAFKYIICNHSRQYWRAPIDKSRQSDIKFNDRLILSLAHLREQGNTDVALLCFEYGPDVEASKQLINEYQLQDRVIWSKQMPRKKILALIDKYIFMGSDQFGGGYFGGTGYEILSCGKPLLNAISISEKEYVSRLNCPFPPVLNVSTPNEIASAIQKVITNSKYYNSLCDETTKWYNAYCGVGLADKFISLLNQTN